MERQIPLSQALWGLDWSRALPHELTADGVTVEASSFQRSLPFIRDHYAAIFEEDPGSPFSTDVTGPAKARWYQQMGDFFELREDGRTIGLLLGEPADWSTYYIRSAAVLREHQGRQLISTFCLRVLFKELERAGVERVECDTSPANLAMAHVLGRLRFNATGTNLSERWGALIRFTKFLNPERERTFLDQLCSGVKYQLRQQRQ
jgi:hypothetical protein